MSDFAVAVDAATPSPNHGPRRDGLTPRFLILHYTGMASLEAAHDRLRDPVAEVSAHYLIARDGRILGLVPEARRAWQAGVSHWRGIDDVNSASIGIEIENYGHDGAPAGARPYPPFSEPQMAAVLRTVAAIVARWGMGPWDVLAHSDIAPGRKIDPGEKFDWDRLSRSGLAAPRPRLSAAADDDAPIHAAPIHAAQIHTAQIHTAPVDEAFADSQGDDGAPTAPPALRAALDRIGYGPWAFASVLDAFRRRFAPERLSAPLTRRDLRLAEAVARASPPWSRPAA